MPKNNTESMQNNSCQDISLRLFFKNPNAGNVFDKYAEIEQKISSKELYGDGEVDLNSIFTDNAIVKIKYQDGLLSIKTTDDVDVFLSGVIPAQAVHIETMGYCALIDGCAKNLSMGLFIKANGTVLDMPITSTGFIAILPGSKADNTVQIKQPLDVSLLRIDAMDLLLGAKVNAGKTRVKCKLLHNFADGELLTGGKQNSNLKQHDILAPFFSKQLLDWDEAVDKHSFIEEHDSLRGKIYRLSESLLIAKNIINEGTLNLTKTETKGCSSIQLLPNSNTILNNVKLLSKEFNAHNLANVTGSNTSLYLDGLLNVEGSCIIDGLVIHTPDATVSGILWGVTSLSIKTKENASFHGIVGAKQTIIKYKYLLAAAVLGNEGQYHETFVNGGIIGTSSLTMDGLACVRTGGAYLYGPTIFLNNGIDVGLFSYIRTFNLVKNCLYEYCTLEASVPCKPEHMSDLMNPNKLLRVTEMIGSNFPGLRGFVSFLNIGKMVGSSCIIALTSSLNFLRDNPDILHQLSNSCKSKLTNALTSLRNDPNLRHQLSYLYQAGRGGANVIAKFAQDEVAFFVNLAMAEWNSDRAKELVEILLQANGLRIYANTIVSQATDALIFVNDVQNLTYSNPNFTFDNIKSAASNFTVSDVLDAAKNVGDNIPGAVGAKLKEARNILETPESRSKFINDNFKVLKKNTTSSNKKPEDVSSGEDQPADVAVQTVTEPTDERITLAQAAKDVVLNQVSEIINAPATIFNRATEAVDAIKSINPSETTSQLLTSTGEKVNAFMIAAKAVRNAEPTPFAIQAPTINEDFLWSVTKESAKLLAPSVYCNSFVSDTGGFMLTGNYIVNTGFYRNSGMVMALGTSVHSLYDSSNYGTIFSHRHTETARNRNNHGTLSAGETNIYVCDNNEYGVTEASTRMIFDIKNHYVSPGAKFRSTGQTHGHISDKMVTHGQQDLRNGHLQHDGITEFDTTADTTLKKMTLDLKHEFDLQGKVHLENISGIGKKPVIFKSTSSTYANNVIFKAPSVYREDGSIINLDNKLLFDAEHVGSGLNSTLNGTADSLFGIKSKTSDELGSHAVGHGVFNIADLSPEAAHRFAYGLGEYQNKTYGHSIRVATETAEPITYAPSARADGAVATLLTRGVVTLPAGYGRANGATFNTYREAERFVAGYDGYNLPTIPLDSKSSSEKFFEAVNEAANVAVAAGTASFSIPGVAVALIGGAVSLFTGHKSRKIAKQRNAIIEAETKRRAGIQRDIDQRVLALDERAELAELYNIRNDSRLNNFFQDLGGSSDLNSDANHLTMQDMLQYRQDIASSYEARRLDSQQQHSNYANEIDKYFAGRREQIRKSGGMNVHLGLAANFGADGYTISGTYGAGSGRNMGYGRVPIYEKTYTRPTPSQQPVETASNRDNTYQWPELPPTTYDDLEFTGSEAGQIGSRHLELGIAGVKNDGYGADEDECTYINEPAHSGNLNGSTQFINNINQKTQGTNTSEQTMLGSIGYPSAESDSQPEHYRSIWDISESQGVAEQEKYSSAYLLNTAYRGLRFAISPIEMFSAGNALEYTQLTESFEEQVARERGYLEQGKALSKFLEHPIDNMKNFTVSYFENSNRAYQEAIASGNYFQAAVIKSNMHFDIAESTIGLFVGGMGAYRVASKVGAFAATQGSRALLWSTQHSMRSPLVFRSDVFLDSLGSSTLNSLGSGGFDALIKATELKNPIKKRVSVLNKDHRYHMAPKTLPGFKDSEAVNNKSERKRWKLPDKTILEWDYQHGEVEMYDKRGRHLGAYDPNTGEKLKNAVLTRRIEV